MVVGIYIFFKARQCRQLVSFFEYIVRPVRVLLYDGLDKKGRAIYG
jgi:hypothetical protein